MGNTLLLSIQASQGGLYRITFENTAWEFAPPWEEQELLTSLYRARVITKEEARRAGIPLNKLAPLRTPQAARQLLKQMGDQLYEALFPPQSSIRQIVEEHLQHALQQALTLSLRLHLDLTLPSLWKFPWELLYAHWLEEDGSISASFIQTINALAIVRYLPNQRPPLFSRLQRIAFFAASPKMLAIPTHQTFEAIRSAWGVDRVITSAGQSWEDWRSLLAQNPDVVHFLGHGDEQDRLLFVKERNAPEPKGANDLISFLPSSVKLLVLQACSSSHLAATLLRDHSQLPLAIGMHYEIGTENADTFALGFHRALLQSRRVEKAIAQARLRMLSSRSTTNQWLLPTLIIKVPKALFTSKSFPSTRRSLPSLTHTIHRDQLPLLQKTLFQHPIISIYGKPDSGRTWLALQALEQAKIPSQRILFFDLSQGGDIYALWHDLLNAFNLAQVQHLYAPELTKEGWEAMEKALAQHLQKEPHVLLIKLPPQPQSGHQHEAWLHLFQALRNTKPSQQELASSPPHTQTILILNQESTSLWSELIGKDAPSISLPLELSEQEIRRLLQHYGFSFHEEEIKEMQLRLSNETIWQLRRLLDSYQGPNELDKIIDILEREGLSLKSRWESFSPLERESLKWAAITNAPLTPVDLLSLLNRTDLSLDDVAKTLINLTRSEWLQAEDTDYHIVPPARPLVLKQMKRPEQKKRLKQWHLHQAYIQQAAQVEAALDDGDLEKAATLLLGPTWEPWELSPSHRRTLLEFIEELWLEQAPLPPDLLFRLAMRAALAARALGDYREAAEWYEEAVEKAPGEAAEVRARIDLAWTHHRSGMFSRREIKDIDDLLQEIRTPSLEARWSFTLGTIYAEQWNYKEAIQALRKGLATLDFSKGDPQDFDTTFSTDISSHLKQWVKSSEGDPLLAAQAMRAYGVATLHSQQPKLALQAFLSSREFYHQANDRYMEGISYNNITAAYLQLGDNEKARQYQEKAKNILTKLGDPAFGRLLLHFNQVMAMLTELTSFRSILTKLQYAREIIDLYGYESHRINVLMETGRAYMMLGQWDKAKQAWHEASNIARNLENPYLQAWSHCLQLEAQLYRLEYHLGTNHPPIAVNTESLREDLRKLKSDDDPELFVSADLFFALYALLQKKPEEAAPLLQRWVELTQNDFTFGVDTRLKWFDLWGMLNTQQENFKEAIKSFEHGLELKDALSAYRTLLRYHYAQALHAYADNTQAQELLGIALQEAEKMEIPWLQEMIKVLQAKTEEAQL